MPGAEGRGGGELRELEASVARTLEACTGRVEGRLPPPPGGLDAWEACPKFHHAVQALQEGLRALEAAGGGGPARAAIYRDRVEALDRQLGRLAMPSFCKMSAGAPPPGPAAAAGSAAAFGAGPPGARGDAAGGVRHRRAGGGAAKAARQRRRDWSVSEGAEAQLAKDREVQDVLTDDMLKMAGALRRNADAMKANLEGTEDLYDGLEAVMDANLAKTNAANKEAKAALKRGWKGTCTNLWILLATGLIFLAVYFLITASKFAGYKAARA